MNNRSLPTEHGTFHCDGYALALALIDNCEVDALRTYVQARLENNELRHGDLQVPKALCCYGDPRMDELLERLVPRVESIVQRPVFPTYSYYRVYQHGDVLAKHRDRPACEISLTLTLTCEGTDSWPLWVNRHGSPIAVTIPQGSGLLYRGTQIAHWREAFDGTSAMQVFLHYVTQDGPFAEWRFDRRSSLSHKKRPESFTSFEIV